jgi:hypothetical protein
MNISASADFSMTASLDAMAAQVQQQHGRAREESGLRGAAEPWQAAELWYIEMPAVAFLGSAAPFVKALWGPNTGYAWAIQRLTVAGLAGADSMLVYRGYSGAADVQPQNIVAPPLVPTAPTYNPGKTGLILMPDQALVFAGTLTGATTYFVSGNAVQMTLDRLPRFME